MTAISAIPAGSRLLASLLQAVAPDAAYKGADESVLNSTTVQNDDALFITLAANATYLFAAVLFYTSGASGDMKAGFTVPSGASMSFASIHEQTGGAFGIDRQTASGSTNVYWNTANAALIAGTVVTSTAAGTMQLQWAQNTANNTTATVMKSGSILAAWQVQ